MPERPREPITYEHQKARDIKGSLQAIIPEDVRIQVGLFSDLEAGQRPENRIYGIVIRYAQEDEAIAKQIQEASEGEGVPVRLALLETPIEPRA